MKNAKKPRNSGSANAWQPVVSVVPVASKTYLQLRWIDRDGKARQKSAGTANPSLAQRAAAALEIQLAAAPLEPDLDRPALTWSGFAEMYESLHLELQAAKTRKCWGTARRHFERIVSPKSPEAITPLQIKQFAADLRAGGLSLATVASYLRHLKAALRWGLDQEVIEKVPKIIPPSRAKGRSKLMRGRPITGEELDRMLLAVALVRPRDAQEWRHLIQGLYLSGLRLGEALGLTWDDPAAGLSIDQSGKYPRFRVLAESEKGHQDRLLPMAPDFARFILDTCPPRQRRGLVFPLSAAKGQQFSANRASRVISACGRKALIRVDATEDRYATAHDLRRSFGTRWSKVLRRDELRHLMRHASDDTTQKYYVVNTVDDISARMWESQSDGSRKTPTSDPISDPDEIAAILEAFSDEQELT